MSRPPFRRPKAVRPAFSVREAETLVEAVSMLIDREPKWFQGSDRAALTRAAAKVGVALIAAGEAKVAR